jgi:Lsr2 protein
MTSTQDVSSAQRITVLKHLAGGKDLDTVAAITSLSREVVLDVGSHHGFPHTDKLARAVEILTAKADEQAAALPERRPEPARPAAPRSIPDAPSQQAPGPLTKPDEIRILLNTAKAHPSKRIQKAADKVFDDLDRLRALITEDEEKHAVRRAAEAEKAAARVEVERLEQQLRDAKAKLRGTTTTASKSEGDDEGPSAAAIRAWALGAKLECPSRGRIPADVRQAYDTAHPGDLRDAS